MNCNHCGKIMDTETINGMDFNLCPGCSENNISKIPEWKEYVEVICLHCGEDNTDKFSTTRMSDGDFCCHTCNSSIKLNIEDGSLTIKDEDRYQCCSHDAIVDNLCPRCGMHTEILFTENDGYRVYICKSCSRNNINLSSDWKRNIVVACPHCNMGATAVLDNAMKGMNFGGRNLYCPNCKTTNKIIDYIYNTNEKLPGESAKKEMNTMNITFLDKLKRELMNNAHLLVPALLGWCEAEEIPLPHIPVLGKAGTYAAALKIITGAMDDGDLNRVLTKATDDLIAIASYQGGKKLSESDMIDGIMDMFKGSAPKEIDAPKE